MLLHYLSRLNGRFSGNYFYFSCVRQLRRVTYCFCEASNASPPRFHLSARQGFKNWYSANAMAQTVSLCAYPLSACGPEYAKLDLDQVDIKQALVDACEYWEILRHTVKLLEERALFFRMQAATCTAPSEELYRRLSEATLVLTVKTHALAGTFVDRWSKALVEHSCNCSRVEDRVAALMAWFRLDDTQMLTAEY